MQGLKVRIRRVFQAWAVLSVLVPAPTANGQTGKLIVAGKHGQGDGRASDLGQQEIDDLIEFVSSLLWTFAPEPPAGKRDT